MKRETKIKSIFFVFVIGMLLMSCKPCTDCNVNDDCYTSADIEKTYKNGVKKGVSLGKKHIY